MIKKQLSTSKTIALMVIACAITLCIITLIEVCGGMSPDRWMRI